MPTTTPAPPSDADAVADGCCATVVASPLAEDDAVARAHTYAAVADPGRLRLLSLVASAGELCSCDMTEPLGKSQPTVSHHTKVLAEAGLIVGDRRGRWTYWSVPADRQEQVRRLLEG